MNYEYCKRSFVAPPVFCLEHLLVFRFRAFGPLRYARITLDPGSGRSRGTGFACFWNKDDADKVVEQSDLLRMETMGGDSVRHFLVIVINVILILVDFL